jgi:hypothetical protein
MVFGTDDNIIYLFPQYKKWLKSRGIEDLTRLISLEKSYINDITIPKKIVEAFKELSLNSWVVLSGVSSLNLKTNFGRFLSENGEKVLVKVYPDKSISVTKGHVYLDKKLVWDGDHKVWKPFFWRGTGVGRAKRLKNPFIKDESISKIITVCKDQIKPYQGVLYG